MGLKVLLLGGTGFLGAEVGRRLVEAGHQVRVLVRDESKGAAYYGRANVQVGDALEPITLLRACAGADLAISLVGVRRNRPQSLLEVNIDGPRLLAEAARQAGMKGIIFVSVVGARLDSQFRYLSSRWMGEEELRKSGVPTAILRFSLILGEGGGLLRDFERTIGFPSPGLIVAGHGEAKYQPIVRDDAARCVVETINHPELVGQALDIGGPEVVTYDQLFSAYCRARGVTKGPIHLPVGLLAPGAAVMELVMRDPVVVPDELRTIQLDSLAGRFDVVQSAFGFSPEAPMAWIRENVKPPPPKPAKVPEPAARAR